MSETDAVEYVLNREDWPEGTTSFEVATAAIKALDAVRSTTWRPLGGPLVEGMTFKSHYLSKTQLVAWIGRGEPEGPELVWLISDGSEHGHVTTRLSPFWRWTAPARMSDTVKTRLTTNKLGLEVGNKLHLDDAHHYKVVATAEKCLLMVERYSRTVWAESNSVLDRYYTWEGKE